MARTPKKSGNETLKTGNDFIGKAKAAGALITPSKKEGFTQISTPGGSMFITPGDEPLDPRTRKNYRHWLRLLGLLVVSGVGLYIVDLIWGMLHLPPIF